MGQIMMKECQITESCIYDTEQGLSGGCILFLRGGACNSAFAQLLNC